MRAILIDTAKCEVREVEVDNGIDAIYNQLGCSCFDCIYIDKSNCIYVDDEGLLTVKPNSVFFLYRGYHSPIVGNGLIKGIDRESGNDIDTTLSVEEVRSKVRFVIIPGSDG